MIDVAGIVATHLRQQPELMALLDDALYTEEAPAGAVVPLAVVRPLADTPLLVDVSTWALATVVVDVIGDPDDKSGLRAISAEIRHHVAAMRGRVIEGAVFQAVDPIAASFSNDPTFTPSLPRWVLTASMTVRSNTPEGVVA